MPNIAAVLKSEIARVAKKELRQEVDALRKAVSSHRSEIAALKRALQEQQRMLRVLQKAAARGAEAPVAAPERQIRFSATRLAAQRKKMGLSAAEFGTLVGATGQAVYNWEAGKARPSSERLAAIAALRGAGKREVAARLAQAREPASD
jgi:DNA-binding transcriptional regulator YiaG